MPSTQPRRTMRRVRNRRAPVKANGADRMRANLAEAIGGILDDQQMTQTEAAYIMQDAPSQVSLVVTGKLRGFSTERLLRMLSKLGRDIDVVVRKSKGKQGQIRYIEE